MDDSSELVLAHALRERGGRVTPQRLAIARVVRELNQHVTAETVFNHLIERLPGVSMPTVYATLELLEKLRLIRRVALDAGAVVFDPRTEDHDHLICRRCGAILDLDAPLDRAPALAAAAAHGFKPDEAQLVVRGVCARCLAAAKPDGTCGVGH